MAVQSYEERKRQRKQQNELLKSRGYRWVPRERQGDNDTEWVLYDPLGRVTFLDVALREIENNQVPVAKPTIDVSERPAAVLWAKAIVAQRPLILDTECTGLTEQDQVIEVAVVDINGNVMINTLLQCHVPIAPKAQEVHRITLEDLQNANVPDYPSIHQHLVSLISARPVVIFNALYDVQMLRQTAAYHGLVLPEFETHCLMRQFSLYYGERRPGNHYECVPKGQKFACELFGISNDNAHRALDDAEAARLVLLRMAGQGLL